MIGKKGLILNSIDYLDSSKIVTLLTSDGIDTITIRGAQKLSSHTFNLAHEFQVIEYETKGKYLSAGKVVKAFNNIILDYEKVKHVLTILEIVYTLKDHIVDYKQAYGFVLDILRLVDEGHNEKLLELIFKAKFLYLLGVGPNFSSCVSCAKTTDLVYFSLTDGGLKCKDCASNDDIVLDFEEISYFRLLYLLKLEKISDGLEKLQFDFEKTNKIIDEFYSYFLGYRSKSSVVFNKLNSKMREKL